MRPARHLRSRSPSPPSSPRSLLGLRGRPQLQPAGDADPARRTASSRARRRRQSIADAPVVGGHQGPAAPGAGPRGDRQQPRPAHGHRPRGRGPRPVRDRAARSCSRRSASPAATRRSRSRGSRSRRRARRPTKTYQNYSAGFPLSWEIDLFGRIRREKEAAFAAYLATEEGRRAALITLVADVASTYLFLRELDLAARGRPAHGRRRTTRRCAFYEKRLQGRRLEPPRGRPAVANRARTAAVDPAARAADRGRRERALPAARPAARARSSAAQALTGPARPAADPGRPARRAPRAAPRRARGRAAARGRERQRRRGQGALLPDDLAHRASSARSAATSRTC